MPGRHVVDNILRSTGVTSGQIFIVHKDKTGEQGEIEERPFPG
jgi:predicted RNA-binding protein with EMAP domain